MKTRQYKKDFPKRNDSYWFLLPILRINKLEMRKAGLINCYLEDHLMEYHHQNSILLLFEYDKKYNEIYDELRSHKYFIEEYDTDGTGDVMFVFKPEEKFNGIISFFKEGMYSKFPNWYKNDYFNKYTNNHTLTEEFKIFQKHEDKRKEISDRIGMDLPEDKEVRSVPNPKHEIYMYNENFRLIEWDYE